MFVGLSRLVLRAPHCHSLKEKRSVVRRLVDKTRARFDVKLSEVASQDSWQRIELGFAVVASEERRAADAVAAIMRFIEEQDAATVVGQTYEVVGVTAPTEVTLETDEFVPPEWRDSLDEEGA